MEKIYVLDTSVLLNAGKTALYGFADNFVVIPLGVVRQLETHTKQSDFAWIAASVLKELEALRVSNRGDIHKGISINDGGFLRIEQNHVVAGADFPASAREASKTLLVAYNLQQEDKDHKVVLVSNDLTQRLTAATLGIEAVPFKRKTAQGEYTGVTTLSIDDNQLGYFYQDGRLNDLELIEAVDYPVRHGFILKDVASSKSALAVKENNGSLVPLQYPENGPVRPRAAEQKFALHHLLNDDVDIVSLGGPAGTGKTLLALYAGYLKLQDKSSNIKKIVVFRPLQEVGGQELGFLPGTEEEKMLPWTQAIRDALSVWLPSFEIDQMFKKGDIEVLPATYIRGRTINNAYIIIDEAQNFERLTLLSILSRLGENSKCVLSWDAAQRDNLYINKDDGVVAIVDRMKSEPLVAHVTLTKTERSRAARMATEILEEMDI